MVDVPERPVARVVGVGRDHAALQRVLALGADAAVALRPDDGGGAESRDDLAARILDAAGAVDVVLDGVYGPPLEAALQVCARRARLVNIGNLAGPTAQVPAGLLRGRQLVLSGFAGLHLSLQDKRPALTSLWAAIAHGELQLKLVTFTAGGEPAVGVVEKLVTSVAAGHRSRTSSRPPVWSPSSWDRKTQRTSAGSTPRQRASGRWPRGRALPPSPRP